MPAPSTIVVRLGARSYRVYVEPGSARKLLPHLLGEAYGSGFMKRVQVIGDARVLRLYPEVWRGLSVATPIAVPPGERSKSMLSADRLWRELARRRVERGSVILAFGGGMVGDLAGFVASTYARGVDLVQVPTTLLAQVDASIGGKTAINIPEGKNLVGTFHQPRFTVVDPELLATLPARELHAGLAEIVKAALIEGGAFWQEIQRVSHRLPAVAPADLAPLIRRSIALKARIVSRDERESGDRRLLNLGHTLAHALEAETAYRHYLHGEAVAVGLVFAAELSTMVAGLSTHMAEQIRALALPLARCPPHQGFEWAALQGSLRRDKKVRDERIHWVLIERPGEIVIRSDVGMTHVKAAVKRLRAWGLV